MSPDPAESGLAYIEFKTARALYDKQLSALGAAERREVRRVAVRQQAIESRVLVAPEAGGVCVPQATLDAALAEIRQRYADGEEFAADLGANGLNLPGLEAALRRELAVEAVLDKVSSDTPPVSDIDAELYYRLHIDRFVRPERRRASHILITINEQFGENRREAARARIGDIAERLSRQGARFAEQAEKHSECPSAMQGGALGDVRRGQLFPALDAVLFALPAGGVSEVVESPLGFHILRCGAILPSGTIPIQEALPHIRALLAESRVRNVQREWLRRVLRGSASTAGAEVVAY